MWLGLVTSWEVEAGAKPGLTSSQGASFLRTWLLRAHADSPAQTSIWPRVKVNRDIDQEMSLEVQ